MIATLPHEPVGKLDDYVHGPQLVLNSSNSIGLEQAGELSDSPSCSIQQPVAWSCSCVTYLLLLLPDKLRAISIAWHVDLPLLLTRYPTHTGTREARAIINLQMGHTDAALQDINVAIVTSPTPILYTERGVIHQFMGDLQSAVTDYKKAITMDPGHHLAHYNLGNVQFHQHLLHQV